ncbi:6-bladed beta-propeller [Acanthopleuribacter pedis]|uniref:Uncharacterized protein n=1 Tax=Acanthopleuribacter pedis TaxID=442870 RepID=A0A8J7QKG6_9BACT|nr:6-bladed beta-propeller [Acanthopleuribacter pedis]MBO1321605.1 hypothetical protein [Acanthopleuribacter pedis]
MIALLFLMLMTPSSIPVPQKVFNLDSEMSWHRPLDVAITEGRFFTLDKDDSSLRSFSESGSFLKKFSGRGQAPGESQGASEIAVFDDHLWVCDSVASSLLIFTLEGIYLKAIRLNSSPSNLYQYHNLIVAAPIALDGLFWILDPKTMSTQHSFGIKDTNFIQVPNKKLETLWLASLSTNHQDGIMIGMTWLGDIISLDIPFQHGKFTSNLAQVSDVWDSKDHIFSIQKAGMPAALSINNMFTGPDQLVWMSVLGAQEDQYPSYILRYDPKNHSVVTKINMGDPIRKMRFFPKKNAITLIRSNDQIELYNPEDFSQ